MNEVRRGLDDHSFLLHLPHEIFSYEVNQALHDYFGPVL